MHKTGPITLVGLSLWFAACSREEAPSAAPPAPAPSAAPSSARAPAKKHWPLPSGPRLAILAGQGVGPIRIGATVATIQRHMELPCEVKEDKVCRYIARGVEFELKNGVTERVRVHRAGRAAGKDAAGVEREYGFFNGAIPPDLAFGMVPKAIQEHLGAPERVETLEAAPPNYTAERHYYPGMIVEYDRHSNGNLIMGGVVIEKPSSDASAATPAPSAR
jgi:hypothetical protein